MNQLKRPEMFKLMKWCEERVESLNGKTDREVAQMASTDLGFFISVGNITGTRRDLEESWVPANSGPAEKRALKDLEERVAAIEGKLMNNDMLKILDDFAHRLEMLEKAAENKQAELLSFSRQTGEQA